MLGGARLICMRHLTRGERKLSRLATPSPSPFPPPPLAAMAATLRALHLSRHFLSPSLLSSRRLLHHHHHLLRFSSPSSPPHGLVCVASGFDGVADESISTRRLGGHGVGGELAALARLLLSVEPLDAGAVGSGASPAARDAMKRTISSLLGLLPSGGFDVSIRVSGKLLHALLHSSILTGYTLWNAEYRISLARNFESSPWDMEAVADSFDRCEMAAREVEDKEAGQDGDICSSIGMVAQESLGKLSPADLSYISKLESEVGALQKELDAEKQKNVYLEQNKGGRNDILEYLRSLDPAMVRELSLPSSEVEGIIQQLVQRIHLKCFDNDNQRLLEGPAIQDVNICTSRDYLAKLLFWCMLLGHQLRGSEYRLQLSCVMELA